MAVGKQAIFDRLRKVLARAKAGLEVRQDTDDTYELYGKKSAEVFGKRVDGVYFAAVVIKKNSVNFYFFPIYTHREEFDDLPDELGRCLKGKSCFHFKKDDDVLFDQVAQAVKKGKTVYKAAGWI